MSGWPRNEFETIVTPAVGGEAIKNNSIGQGKCGLIIIIDVGNIKMIKNIITDVIDFFPRSLWVSAH